MAKIVSDVMTRSPRSCKRTDSLVMAAKIFWEHDCGAAPVVDDNGRVVGMITDRDCLMAAFTRGRKLDDLSVQSAMAHMVFSIREDQSVEAAAERMAEHAVRRLPVVDAHGRLVGMVSFADVCGPKAGLKPEQLAKAASAIGAPRGQAAAVAPAAPVAAVQMVASAPIVVVPPVASSSIPAAQPPAKAASKAKGKRI
jgi:CBS domain-containing protein